MLAPSENTTTEGMETDEHIRQVTHAFRVLWPYLGEQRRDPGLLIALASLINPLLQMAADNPRLARALAADEIGREIDGERLGQDLQAILGELLASPGDPHESI